MNIYFDNAASTPLDPQVLEEMLPYMTTHFGNPSSIHALGRKSRSAIEKARKIVAKHLNASTAEVFFTSGGTESNNLAILGAIRDMEVKRFISSPIEHHCVLHTLEKYHQDYPIQLDFVQLDDKGHVDLNSLEDLLKSSDTKTMVSLMNGNNEIGNITSLEKVSELCQEYGAYFHTDSVQTLGRYPFDVQSVKIDFLSGSSHKFHGPKGSGILYCNADNKIAPLLLGGSQERNMRAGTENLYGIVGFAKALDLAYENLEADSTHIKSLKKHFADTILNAIPEVTFNGDHDGDSLYTVLNIGFPPSMGELILFNLDIEGICASGGSACSSGVNTGSHVLNAINSPRIASSVRFSFSKMNTIEEVNQVTAKIIEKALVK